MILVGDIEKDSLARIALTVARLANRSDAMLLWVTGSGTVCCAHESSKEARQVEREAGAYIVGNYTRGADFARIAEDLFERKLELDPEAKPARITRKAA